MSAFDDPTDPPGGWQLDHVARYAASAGADGHEWLGFPTLLLTTLGRRTGRARRTALIYATDAGRFLVVGSNGGSDVTPSWYLNLRADPRVRLQIGAEVFGATAATATPAELAALWPVIIALNPHFDDYRAKTNREIPLVVLTRD